MDEYTVSVKEDESVEDIMNFFKKARPIYRELIKELLEKRPATPNEIFEYISTARPDLCPDNIRCPDVSSCNIDEPRWHHQATFARFDLSSSGSSHYVGIEKIDGLWQFPDPWASAKVVDGDILTIPGAKEVSDMSIKTNVKLEKYVIEKKCRELKFVDKVVVDSDIQHSRLYTPKKIFPNIPGKGECVIVIDCETGNIYNTHMDYNNDGLIPAGLVDLWDKNDRRNKLSPGDKIGIAIDYENNHILYVCFNYQKDIKNRYGDLKMSIMDDIESKIVGILDKIGIVSKEGDIYHLKNNSIVYIGFPYVQQEDIYQFNIPKLKFKENRERSRLLLVCGSHEKILVFPSYDLDKLFKDCAIDNIWKFSITKDLKFIERDKDLSEYLCNWEFLAKWFKLELNYSDTVYDRLGLDPLPSEFGEMILPTRNTYFPFENVRTRERFTVKNKENQDQLSSVKSMYDKYFPNRKEGDVIMIAVNPFPKSENIELLFDHLYNKEKNVSNIQTQTIKAGIKDIETVRKSGNLGIGSKLVNEIKNVGEGTELNLVGKQTKIENGTHITRYIDEQCVDKQVLTSLLHKSIINKIEKDNILNTVDINDVIDSIPETGLAQIAQIVNNSIDCIKVKNDKESNDRRYAKEKLKKKEEDIKLELEKVKKDAKDRAEKISIEEYVKMFHERLRQGLYMYRESDIKFFFSSILSGKWTNLRGVNGFGKDFLLILFGMLSCEDFDDQVLIVPPSIGQEIDDTRILGYQSSLTDKYYHSRTSEHFVKSNKNPDKLYMIINTEANIVNMDRAYLPISVATDSAQSKITLPRFRKEGDTHLEEDPKNTDNMLIFNTTNDIIRRPEISLKDIDRMSIMNLVDPIMRSTEDREKLENDDGTNNYKPITGPEPIFVELAKKHIIMNNDRTTNLRDLYYADSEYRKFENEYQDDLVCMINKLNNILKNGHLRNAQMASRFTENALKFLYVTIKKLKIDPKLAKSQLMLERFIPRIEDVREEHIDILNIIKDELTEWLSDKEADPIKEIDEIIWKLDSRHVSKKK